MKSLKLFLMIVMSSALLAACGQKDQAQHLTFSPVAGSATVVMDMGGGTKIADSREQALTETSETNQNNTKTSDAIKEVKRYVALRHSIVVETLAQQMQAVFDATVAHCEQLKCQVLNSNFNRETQFNPPIC